MRMRFWCACLCAIVLCRSSFGQKVVVNNSVTRFGQNDFTLWVDTSPNCDFPDPNCGVGASFKYSGHSIELMDPTADFQDYYVTQFGDVFNPNGGDVFDPAKYAMTDGEYGRSLLHGDPVEVGKDEFYVGVWLPFELEQNYGWIHFRPVDGALTIVSEVMSYSSPGIVIGTTTVVPEPGSVEIILISLATICFGYPEFNRNKQEIRSNTACCFIPRGSC